MSISASEVAKLRKATGAGMMDCKKALEESNGDFEKAIEIIRKKGQLVASKRADREASEGCVLSGVAADGKYAAVVALNCETDFVAKNADFVALTKSILDLALSTKPANLDALKSSIIDGRTVADLITDKIGVTGEKMDLSYFDFVSSEKVISYIHPGNKLATVVGFNVDCDNQVAKNVAMQVAAMSPVAVDKEDVPAAVLEKEREIALEQTANDPKNAGKPAEIVAKIAEGRIQKFFIESTLLNQEFVMEGKQSVRQYLQSVNKNLTVTSFKRFTLNA
jgi:elongation factor Ts